MCGRRLSWVALHASPSSTTVALRAQRATETGRAFRDRVLDGIVKFLDAHDMKGGMGAREFRELEKTLHERMLEAELETLSEAMAASDVDADAIEVEGRVLRRTLLSPQTCMTPSGEVQVERWLYRDRSDPTARAVAAMDRRLGIVEGSWA